MSGSPTKGSKPYFLIEALRLLVDRINDRRVEPDLHRSHPSLLQCLAKEPCTQALSGTWYRLRASRYGMRERDSAEASPASPQVVTGLRPGRLASHNRRRPPSRPRPRRSSRSRDDRSSEHRVEGGLPEFLRDRNKGKPHAFRLRSSVKSRFKAAVGSGGDARVAKNRSRSASLGEMVPMA